jgi:hypothetical protein
LSPQQQNALWAEARIPVSDLKPEAQLLFMQALEDKERPTYKDAQDPSWPRTATIALGSQEMISTELFAMADMRSLDTWTIPMLDAKGMTPDEDGAIRVPMQQAESQLPELAKTAAAEIAAKHPEVSAKKIGIYALYAALMQLSLGEAETQSHYLPYCQKIR